VRAVGAAEASEFAICRDVMRHAPIIGNELSRLENLEVELCRAQ
jgi:hypothetical protein